MSIAYLDGAAVFGEAVKVQHAPNPSAQQVNSFFGISGSQVVWGGTRGRAFFITGVLIGQDIPSLAAAEAILLSYDDGISRVLTDTWGRDWPAVVFTGNYQPDPMGPRPAAGDGFFGWALPYRATFFSPL